MLYRINDFVMKTSSPQQPESSSIQEQGYLCIVFLESSFSKKFLLHIIAHFQIKDKQTNRLVDGQKNGPTHQQTDN